MTKARLDPARLLAFVGILVVLFLVSTNMTVVGTALPRIIAELDGFHLYAWAFNAFIFTSTLAVLVTGRLSDTYGRRRLMLIGIVVFSVASAAAGFTGTMPQLVVLRAMQGIGGGMVIAMTWAALGDLFTPRERGAYQGFMSGVFALSSVIGPIIGGVLTDTVGWRWVFFVNIPIALVAFIMVARYLPQGARRGARGLDVAGTLLLSTATLALLLALGVFETLASPPAVLVGALVATTLVSSTLFVWWERRAVHPLVPLVLFREPTMALATIGTSLGGAAMFAAIMYLPLYIQGVVGASAAASGFALAPMMVGFVVAGIVSGRAVSRSGWYKPWIVGASALTVLAFAAGGLLAADSSIPLIVTISFAMGLGLGPPLSLYVLAAQNATSPRLLGTVTSTVQFFRQIGGMLAVAAFGGVVAAALAAGVATTGATLADASQDTVALATSPNTLTDPERMARLVASLERELGVERVEHVVLAVRSALGHGLRLVFLLAAAISVASLVAALWMPSRQLSDSAAPGEDTAPGELAPEDAEGAPPLRGAPPHPEERRAR
jgi:multidrug resistance protein